MIRLNKFILQLFAKKDDGVKAWNELDGDGDEKTITAVIGGKTYSWPASVFKQVGHGDKTKYSMEQLMTVAIYAAAYEMNTGIKIGDLAKKYDTYSPDKVSKLTAYVPKQTQEDMFDTIAAWAKTQGHDISDLKAAATYSVNDSVLAHVSSPYKSFQQNLQTTLNNGSVKIDGERYKEWSSRQPQLQPGYHETYGVPIGKDDASGYVYKNDAGAFIDNQGNVVNKFFDLNNNEYNLDPLSGNYLGVDGNPYQAPTNKTARDDAYDHFDFNAYYDDIMSRKEGTFGGDALANITRQHEVEAANAQLMADAAIQQQAIQQTRNVKAITDNLRAERMAQLRSGMNEAQLAEREIQMLMMQNQFMNAQATQAAQESLQAHLAGQTAREQAYSQWLETMAPYSQVIGANYASQVGDPVTQAKRLKEGKEQELFGQGHIDSIVGK